MTPTVPNDIIDLDESSDDATYYGDLVDEDRIGHGVQGLSISPDRASPGDADSGPRSRARDYQACLSDILDLFPDISHDHVQEMYNKHMETRGPYQIESPSQALVDRILDGGRYPKERDRKKRKFSERDSDEEEAAKWKYSDLRDDPSQYQTVAKLALQEAFELVPAKFIEAIFKEHHHYYGAFFAILAAERAVSSAQGNPPFAPLKSRRVSTKSSTAVMTQLEQDGFSFDNLKKEIDSAFQRRRKDEALRKAAREAEQAEEAEDQRLRAMGQVMECQCCYDEFIPPKMTHCDGEACHFFCLGCAKMNANTVIGNSRYVLQCMDGSGCKGSFSRHERSRFLDDKTIEKLERLQQQDEIRMADLQNLATCPFCEFAAICPPMEEDREFRCHNPQCEEISCRLCKAKTHIPLSCEEFRKETGISERRVIEEARTEALIRTCGKCKVRILKEDGCNKVICTSCSAVLCDYCGKDISKAMYNHFDGQGRAPAGLQTNGPGAKCPLYDESSKRKDRQVEEAEKEAMAKVRAEHPDLSEDDLRIKFAKSVQSGSGLSSSRPPQWRMGQPPMVLPINENNLPRIGRVARRVPEAPEVFGLPPRAFNGLHQDLNQLQVEGQQRPAQNEEHAPQDRRERLLHEQQRLRHEEQRLHQLHHQNQQRAQQYEQALAHQLQQQALMRQHQARLQDHLARRQRQRQQPPLDENQRINEALGHRVDTHQRLAAMRRAHTQMQEQRAALLAFGPRMRNPFAENVPIQANEAIGNGVTVANAHVPWGLGPNPPYLHTNSQAQNPFARPNPAEAQTGNEAHQRIHQPEARLDMPNFEVPSPQQGARPHHRGALYNEPNANWYNGPGLDGQAPRENHGYW